MTGVDTNVLIDLLVSSMPNHNKSLQAIANLNDELCTTPTNIGECLRLLTHPKLFPKPTKISMAVDALRDLFEALQIQLLEEDRFWWEHLKGLEAQIPDLRGNEVFDARIALCLKHNGVKRFFTYDSDFRKYSFLQIIKST